MKALNAFSKSRALEHQGHQIDGEMLVVAPDLGAAAEDQPDQHQFDDLVVPVEAGEIDEAVGDIGDHQDEDRDQQRDRNGAQHSSR